MVDHNTKLLARGFTVRASLIAAIGGFLMGFDASVISGVVGFIGPEFGLTSLELGWSVACLTLTATVAMLAAGPLSDEIGRRAVLFCAAALFAISAVASAVAPDFTALLIARMLGGFGVGAALIVAPMYIAELSPAACRGRLVSLNQLNIVIGISAAFFSNYLILQAAQADFAWVQWLRVNDWPWRWMLGIEAVPALVYLAALPLVPESPRWLAMHGRTAAALDVFSRVHGPEAAKQELSRVNQSLEAAAAAPSPSFRQLLQPALRLVMTIGVAVAVLQQITGINSVFFYAPLIFEQSGIGTDAAFMQAVLVGVVNLVFTVLAILTIDRLGRRPLVLFGLAGIAVCMFTLAYGFHSARYVLTPASVADLPDEIDRERVAPLVGVTFDDNVAYRRALGKAIGEDLVREHQSALTAAAVRLSPALILAGILGFVACFAVSLGPVMWVLFSELFPNRLRGLAISVAGLINSGVSFLVQLVFPWELANLGNSATFLVYGLFAVGGFVLLLKILPETRGRSLEELECLLVREK